MLASVVALKKSFFTVGTWKGITSRRPACVCLENACHIRTLELGLRIDWCRLRGTIDVLIAALLSGWEYGTTL